MPLACQECGSQFERFGSRGPVPKWCGSCRKARNLEAGRRYRSGTGGRVCVACGVGVGPSKRLCRGCAADPQRPPISFGANAACAGCAAPVSRRRKWCDTCARWQKCVREGRRRVAVRETSSEPIVAAAIFARDLWACRLCGGFVPRGALQPHPLSPSLDHIIPLALGGAHVSDNLQLAHLRCNIAKGARLAEVAS